MKHLSQSRQKFAISKPIWTKCLPNTTASTSNVIFPKPKLLRINSTKA